MLIERPPCLYRLLFPEAIWRIKRHGRRVVYLTFDDGPIPEVTPWILDTLDRLGVKATFFLVGDNVRRHPELLADIRRRGHSYGNHTMHHVHGIKSSRRAYLKDITEADRLIDSPLFRPPHGLLWGGQAKAVKHKYNLVMYDLITRDYNHKLSPERVLHNVKRYARNGSIIVFHDSLKARRNMEWAMPRAVEWLLSQGYEFDVLPM